MRLLGKYPKHSSSLFPFRILALFVHKNQFIEMMFVHAISLLLALSFIVSCEAFSPRVWVRKGTRAPRPLFVRSADSPWPPPLSLELNVRSSLEDVQSFVSSSSSHDLLERITTVVPKNLPQILPKSPLSSTPLSTLYDAFCDTALAGAHPPALVFLLVPLLSLTIATAFTPIEYPTSLPYGDAMVYNPPLAAKFYGKRPLLILHRLVQLAFSGFPLGASLFVDKYITKKLDDEPTKKTRAKTLLTFVENNGCTYIKIGQALSVREDIIDAAYAKELSQLQDRVPPFESNLAKSILASEVGSITSTFTKISDAPVASASIGQVYKATTADGKEVAVKVQRPNVVNVIGETRSESEKRQIGKKARTVRIVAHIANRIDVDETGHCVDNNQHHRRQAINLQTP